jgi:hypothetical protein
MMPEHARLDPELAKIYEIQGAAMDRAEAAAMGALARLCLQTADEAGLRLWEELAGMETDASLPPDYRRQRVRARNVVASPTNAEAIRLSVEALTGAAVEVIENTAPYTFEAGILPAGGPINLGEARRLIREIAPAHLAFDVPLATNAAIGIRPERAIFRHRAGMAGRGKAGARPRRSTKFRSLGGGIEAGAEAEAFLHAAEMAGTGKAGTEPRRNTEGRLGAEGMAPAIAAEPFGYSVRRCGTGRAGSAKN